MSARGAALYRHTVGEVLVACARNFALASDAQAPRFNVSPQAAAGKKLFAQSCLSRHETNSRNQIVGPGFCWPWIEGL